MGKLKNKAAKKENQALRGAKTQKKQKEPKRSLGIRAKLNGMIICIVFLFSAMLLFTATKFMEYNTQYEGVLENISKISYIKTNSTKVARMIVNFCATGTTKIEDSGHPETVATMKQYLKDIEVNIGDDPEYNQNRNMLASLSGEVDKYVALYDEIVGLCGDTYSSKANTQAASLDSSTSFITTNADNLLSYEVIRSEDLQSEIQKDVQGLFSTLIIIIVAMAVITLILAMVVSGSITRPIQKLKKNLALIADGDLSGADIVIKSKDETGHLGIAFNKMKGNMSKVLGQISDSAVEIKDATGTVDTSIAENVQGTARIADSVGEMLVRLQKQQDEVTKIVDQIQEMEQVSGAIVQNAEKIHSNTETTRSNAENGMGKIIAYVKQLALINESIQDVSKVFKGFDDNTRQMTEALNAISDIASQTNLLSLNASIEAARAGEAGKGFAVVADEIRKLADDSQEAAKDIGDMIKRIQDESEHMNAKLTESLMQLEKGNEMTAETRNSFEVIKNGTGDVGDSVSDIMEKLDILTRKIESTVSSASEIQSAADESVMEINEVNAVVTQETASVESISVATGKLLELTQVLDNMVNEFKLN